MSDNYPSWCSGAVYDEYLIFRNKTAANLPIAQFKRSVNISYLEDYCCKFTYNTVQEEREYLIFRRRLLQICL